MIVVEQIPDSTVMSKNNMKKASLMYYYFELVNACWPSFKH